jgi:hypothetical protein
MSQTDRQTERDRQSVRETERERDTMQKFNIQLRGLYEPSQEARPIQSCTHRVSRQPSSRSDSRQSTQLSSRYYPQWYRAFFPGEAQISNETNK